MADAGDALNTASTWLATVLGGDATLTALVTGVVEDVSPDESSSYPVVVFTYQASLADSHAVGQAIIVANPLYEVRVVDKGDSYEAAAAAYSRVHALIHKKGGIVVSTSLGTGRIVSCTRQQPLQLREGIGGVEYRSVGGLYQLQVN